MQYNFSFNTYKRRFCQPLKTSHGVWKIREGIIIRLSDNYNNFGCGEIAPLPWFGSESSMQALAFCQGLGGQFSEVGAIPQELPCCRFAFESALKNLSSTSDIRDPTPPTPNSYSYLLPAGENALVKWRDIWDDGGRTFKWKIGVNETIAEIKIFDRLINELPEGVKLRLDANGGLTFDNAIAWLKVCDRYPNKIEFIEQPLSVKHFNRMLDLSKNFSTAIALDESVSSLMQLEDCYRKGWRSIFIIKAAIAGSPSLLSKFIEENAIDVVFSSVFETSIGRNAVLNLAAKLNNPSRAIGFGVSHWFNEDEEEWLNSLWNDL